MQSSGFRPVADGNARVLILGSLPGAMSLARGQYYAQPRNTFWRVLGQAIDADLSGPYDQRLARLRDARIALWDVCASASREGSLDAAIDPDSVIVNDFAPFLTTLPTLEAICFNGATAGHLFRRRVLPQLDPSFAALRMCVLPSTSPAHAAMQFDRKVEAWRIGITGTG